MEGLDRRAESERQSPKAIEDLEIEARESDEIAGGKVQPRDISMTKQVDKSSPQMIP